MTKKQEKQVIKVHLTNKKSEHIIKKDQHCNAGLFFDDNYQKK